MNHHVLKNKYLKVLTKSHSIFMNNKHFRRKKYVDYCYFKEKENMLITFTNLISTTIEIKKVKTIIS
jgi:hypothetical protein